MVTVIPCQPTIGKVELILNDVFKLSRFIGTFPIDSEYSGISKLDIAKVVLYIFPSILATIVSCWIFLNEDLFVALKIVSTIHAMSPVIFYWIHLAWLLNYRFLLEEFYKEMKDVEYILWKSGVYWFYKPSWFTKYLSLAVMSACSLTWIILYVGIRNSAIIDHVRAISSITTFLMFTALMTVVNQYSTLVVVLVSILREIKSVTESKTVIKLTDQLLNLCQKVNSIYEPQIFIYIIIIFAINLFYIYGRMILQEYFSTLSLIWLMSFISSLVYIVISIREFSQEVKKINKMLYRRLLHNLDDEILQFHLVAKRDIVFTAAGFFTLENTLICTMFTTGVNYLVFFIQYM
ncbi:Gustatory receptor 111 [Halyomorpha halys]|nr:Gustatory receptor 111 [Halyomorpha halys]